MTYHPSAMVPIAKTIIVAAILLYIIYVVQSYFPQIPDYIYFIIVALAVIEIFYEYVMTRAHSIDLTDNAVEYRYGVFSKKSYILPYSKISESSFNQSFFHRLIGLGVLKIDTPGSKDVPVNLGNMRSSDVKQIQDRINLSNKVVTEQT